MWVRISLHSLKQYILEQLPKVKFVISIPALRTDKANANLTNIEVTELLLTYEEKIITHSNIKDEYLSKCGLHIDTRISAKFLLLGAQAIWHAKYKYSSIKAQSEILQNINEKDSIMPICQILEH